MTSSELVSNVPDMTTRIVVVTAVRPETRAALAALCRPRRVRQGPSPRWEGRAGPNHVILVQGGVGREAARRAVTATSRSCDVVVSLGFAGALVPGSGVGDFVLSGTVLWEENGGLRRYDVPDRLIHAVETALPNELRRTAVRGALLSSPVVLTTPTQKEQAARQYGAVAVDMEAAALASYAAEHGVPFLTLRAILDPVDLSLVGLPRNLDGGWTAWLRVLGMPVTWLLLRVLARHAQAASATLTKVAATVFPAL